MFRLRSRRGSLVGILAGLFLAATVGIGGASAAPKCNQLPALADISTMDEVEVAEYAKRPCNAQLVSYEKVFIPFDVAGDPLSPIPVTGASADRAATSQDGLVSALGSDTDDHGLYLSISASRNTGTSYCSDWSFSGHFRWNNAPTSGKNLAYDFWGMVWAGNQALTSTGSAYGIDIVGTTRTHSTADVLANEGIIWRFREWPSSPGIWVKYGYAGQSVRQRTCAGLSNTVALKYIHTFSDATYSVSIGAGNPGSVSVSPASNQWQFAVSAGFSY